LAEKEARSRMAFGGIEVEVLKRKSIYNWATGRCPKSGSVSLKFWRSHIMLQPELFTGASRPVAKRLAIG